MQSIARNQATAAQIRILEDAAVNPLTAAAWPKGHQAILKGRRQLPIYERFDEILAVYHQNQVVILTSETGSGKSIQVPQALMYDEYASGLKVACTQPRRLGTTSLAKRVATEMGVKLGEEVGYQIGGSKMVNMNEKKTRLSYMTEGILLRMLASDKDLSKYACIIIDEVHERTVEADMLMAMLKKIMIRRKDFKVVIISATMDAKIFQDYFNNSPLVHITGRNFKVDIRYVKEEDAHANFNVLAAQTALFIHRNKDAGNILIFLPGKRDIGTVCGMLTKYADDLDVYPLYSALPHDKQGQALSPAGPNRKCIVSTNIAEISLTIGDVVYVVDTGLSNQMVYNPRLDMNMLRIMPISQASARQRTGRAGRTRDGVCYRLYSKEAFDNLAPSTPPAILSASLDQAALRLAAAGDIKIANLDWIDAPHPESLARAAMDLQDWGYLADDGTVTQPGKRASRSTLSPIWYRAIPQAAKNRCAVNALDIISVCNSQRSIHLRVPSFEQVADMAKNARTSFPSDHLALYNTLSLYMRVQEIHQQQDSPKFDLERWCMFHFVDSGAMEEVLKIREKVGSFMKLVKVPPVLASQRDVGKLQRILARALPTRLAIHHGNSDAYRTVHENVGARLETTSSLVTKHFDWVVYNNLKSSGGRVHIETTTPIDLAWVSDLPYFEDFRLPVRFTGAVRQEMVKQCLDRAKANLQEAKPE
ncbi:hypothetical protein K4F52_006800 [Lecanicillium sp. MT-2017a]|nr:hypothetical protein K4F52_006800 [Lecanicillium sp. MT-2017a]